MKRFDQLVAELPSPFRFNQIQLGVDLGSSTTKVRVNNSLRLVQPTCAIVHEATSDLIALGAQAARYQVSSQSHTAFRAPVRKGVITDVPLTVDYLKAMFNQALRADEVKVLTSVKGVCVLPSKATKVEQTIFSKTFSDLGFGSWRFVPKSAVWQQVLQSKLYQGLAGCIDMGGDTTEIILIDTQMVVAATIPLGGRTLIKRLLYGIRSDHGFQLGWESGETLLKELAVPSTKEVGKKSTKVIVRGKNMTTGRPETLELPGQAVADVVVAFFDELVAAMHLFLAEVPTALLTNSIDAGLLLSGGLSQMEGTKEYFERALQTSITRSTTPQEDLVRHLW